MIRKIYKNNPVYFVFLFPALVDGVVTLLGQGSNYWHSPSIAKDASPAYYFLIVSPYLFILGSILWFVFWYFAFIRFRPFFKYFFAILFIAGHSWGSSSWIIKMTKEASWFNINNQFFVMSLWLILIIYFCVTALIAASILTRYTKNNF